jgi:hypothetical protein
MGAVHDGYVAVTPLHLDLTNHRAMMQMTDWPDGLSAQLRADRGGPRRARRSRRGA